jgi:hypothetical protein
VPQHVSISYACNDSTRKRVESTHMRVARKKNNKKNKKLSTCVMSVDLRSMSMCVIMNVGVLGHELMIVHVLRLIH